MSETNKLLKTLNLYSIGLLKQKISSFIRITIYDTEIQLTHIINKHIEKTIRSNETTLNEIFNYLANHKNIFIDIIIANTTMSCKSISLNKLREKDISSLAQNILRSNDNLVNLVCYEKKLSYRSGIASIFSMKLNKAMENILNDIINADNPINSIIPSPAWIVSSYFDLHKTEKGKFKVQIFVINYESKTEIIALHGEKYIHYKKGNSSDINENEEINNAIKLANQLFNTNIDDTAIYYLNDEMLNKFVISASINTCLVSNDKNFITINKLETLNMAIKCICIITFVAMIFNTFSNVIQIFKYNEKINYIKNFISTADSELIKEVDFWRCIKDYIIAKPVNFKAKLSKTIKTSDKKLRNVSIKLDEKSMQSRWSYIYED